MARAFQEDAIKNARKGNSPIYKEIMERIHGKVTEKTEVAVEGNVTFVIQEATPNDDKAD